MPNIKLCPFISNGDVNVLCKHIECMAWVLECPSDVVCNDGETASYCSRIYCDGYCKLIEGTKK